MVNGRILNLSLSNLGVVLLLCFVGYRYLILGRGLTEGIYPDPKNSEYRLPWESGVSFFCFQGTGGFLSHRGRVQYAWDFLMPTGTRILAARSGTVVSSVDVHEGRGRSKPNNEIFIDHGDGTVARYSHIQKNGSKVRPGDSISRGQLIALSGDVGRSLGPHLHFEVVDKNNVTIPISFHDVKKHEGVPRTSFFYRSGNTANEVR